MTAAKNTGPYYDKEVVKLLLSAGADVNLQSNVCEILTINCYDEEFFIFVLTFGFIFCFLEIGWTDCPHISFSDRQ